MTESDPIVSRRRKAFMLAKDIGLSDEERHELATIILRRDITSWGQLNEAQLERLLDALEGYEKISHLLSLRV